MFSKNYFSEFNKIFEELNQFSPSTKGYSVNANGMTRVLDVAMLGHTKESVDISVDETTVKVKASATPEMSNLAKSHEFNFRLPDNCDSSKISAKVEAGILKITLPYLEKTKARVQKIEVL